MNASIELTIEEERTISFGWCLPDGLDDPEWTEEEWTYNFAIISMAHFRTTELLRQNSIRITETELMWADGNALAFVDVAAIEEVPRALELAQEALRETVEEYDALTKP